MKFVNTSVWCLEVWSRIDRTQRASMLRFGGVLFRSCIGNRRCSEDKLAGYSFRTSMLPDLVLKHAGQLSTAHIKNGYHRDQAFWLAHDVDKHPIQTGQCVTSFFSFCLVLSLCVNVHPFLGGTGRFTTPEIPLQPNPQTLRIDGKPLYP